ncbi:hypothetical protein DEI93_07195 [Curtobacterium sp. MCBD17_035]|uniref:hypothetical protein n=1 Tax=Curtobacterium sp. MCBD17_035 TaxID=2175673 RepID=UPI000DA7B2F9|nr:hypothetical protein [Curtobacterium sp. MCBD17_035]WIB68807.1 hypothetical protein DEI93_07195 [Curtobacterium sp. MCBD17_035]
MTSIEKQTAQIVLDLLSGTEGATSEERRQAFLTSGKQLQEAGALPVVLDDDGTALVDPTKFLIGITLVDLYLVQRLTGFTGLSREEVMFDARQFVDSLDI